MFYDLEKMAAAFDQLSRKESKWKAFNSVLDFALIPHRYYATGEELAAAAHQLVTWSDPYSPPQSSIHPLVSMAPTSIPSIIKWHCIICSSPPSPGKSHTWTALSNEFHRGYRIRTQLIDDYHFPYFVEFTDPRESQIWTRPKVMSADPAPAASQNQMPGLGTPAPISNQALVQGSIF